MNALSGPQNSPDKVRFIDPNDEVDFNDDWKKLLHVAFEKADWIYVIKRLSGYSGAQTWSIQPQTGPTSQLFVVKFDEPRFLQREYRKATNDVTGGALFGNPITPEGEIVRIPGNRWALMKSTLKGMKNSDTLMDHLQIEGATYIERILRSVFTRDNRLPANIQKRTVSYSTYYDRLLPEHFRFDGLKGNDENAYKIEATQLQPRHIAVIEKDILANGRNVELREFYLEKVKPTVWTLRTDRPTEHRPPRIRIKYRPAEGQALPVEYDQPIPLLFGQNPQSRLDLLRGYATDVLRITKTDRKTFAYRNIKFPNPLYFLSELLSKPNELKITLIHGDLNLRNILIAIYKNEQGEVTDIKDWLIDFADTDMGPVLLDLQWLEVQVILWFLAPAINKAQLNITVLIDLFSALHECSTDYSACLNPHLQTSYTILRHIRLLAKEYLVDDWSEYYHGLVLALLGALRLRESVTDFDTYAPRVAFLSAAIVLSWAAVVPSDDLKTISAPLQLPPKPPLPPPPPPKPSINPDKWRNVIWPIESLSIDGTAAPKAIILVMANQVTVATAVADKTGHWQATFPLPEIGSYQIVAKDKSTDAESVPLITSVKTPPQIDQASVPQEVLVRKKFSLMGSAQPRAILQVIANGEIIASPTVDRAGRWQAEVVLNKPGEYLLFLQDESNRAVSEKVSITVLQMKLPLRMVALITTLLLAIVAMLFAALMRKPPADWTTPTAACTTIKNFGLTIGASDNSGPYSFEENGNIVGFEIDLLREVIKDCVELDAPASIEPYLVIIPVKPAGRQQALQDDQVQIVVGSVSNIPERCPTIDWICTDAYAFDEQVLAVRKDGSIQEYCDPDLSVIAVITGTTGYTTLSEYEMACNYSKPIETKLATSREIALQWVANSTVQAYKADGDLIRFIIERDEEFKDLTIVPGGPVEQIGMWLPATKKGLSALIDNTIRQMKKDGRLKHLCEQYFTGYSKDCNTFPIGRASQIYPLGLAIAGGGDNSPLARDQRIALDFAFDVFNTELKKILIQFSREHRDAGSDKDSAVQAFRQLIAEKVIALIGPTYSFQLFAIFQDETIKNAEIPLVSTSATALHAAHPNASTKLNHYNFRTSSGVINYAGYAVDALLNDDVNIKSVVVAYRANDEFTDTEYSAFKASVEAYPNRITSAAYLSYTNSITEFTKIVSSVLEIKPDLFILSGLFGDGSEILKRLTESDGYTGKMIIGNGLNTTEIFKYCKLKCNGIYIAQAYSPAWENEGNQVFRQRYAEYYDQHYKNNPLLPQEPSQIMAQMYTAVQVIAEALLVIDKDREANGRTRLRDLNLNDQEELAMLRRELNETLLTSEEEQSSGSIMTFDTPLGKDTWFDQDGDIQQNRFCVAEIQMQSEESGSFVIQDGYGLDCK